MELCGVISGWEISTFWVEKRKSSALSFFWSIISNWFLRLHLFFILFFIFFWIFFWIFWILKKKIFVFFFQFFFCFCFYLLFDSVVHQERKMALRNSMFTGSWPISSGFSPSVSSSPVSWDRLPVLFCLLSLLTSTVLGVASAESHQPTSNFITSLGVWRRLRMLQLKTRRQETRNSMLMAEYHKNLSERMRYGFGIGKRSAHDDFPNGEHLHLFVK